MTRQFPEERRIMATDQEIALMRLQLAWILNEQDRLSQNNADKPEIVSRSKDTTSNQMRRLAELGALKNRITHQVIQLTGAPPAPNDDEREIVANLRTPRFIPSVQQFQALIKGKTEILCPTGSDRSRGSSIRPLPAPLEPHGDGRPPHLPSAVASEEPISNPGTVIDRHV